MEPTLRFFRPGQHIFNEGDPSHSLFLIQKGSISILKRKDSAFVELGRIFSNQVIGEMSFFDRNPRSASAVALTEVEALEISFQALDGVYQGIPSYLRTIIASLVDRLRRADDSIRRLQTQTVSGNPDDPQAHEAQMDAASVLEATSGVGIAHAEVPKDEE